MKKGNSETKQGKAAHLRKYFDPISLMFIALSLLAHSFFLVLVFSVAPDPQSLSLDIAAEQNVFVRYLFVAQTTELSMENDTFTQSWPLKSYSRTGVMYKSIKLPLSKWTDGNMVFYRYNGLPYTFVPGLGPEPNQEEMALKMLVVESNEAEFYSPNSIYFSDFVPLDPYDYLGPIFDTLRNPNYEPPEITLADFPNGEGTIVISKSKSPRRSRWHPNPLRTLGAFCYENTENPFSNADQRQCRASGPLEHHCYTREASNCVQITENYSKTTIRSSIEKFLLPSIRACFEEQLTNRPELSGRIALRIVIAPSGDVMASDILNSTVRDLEVERCIAQVVSENTFPESADGQPVTVNYPFFFAVNR